MERSKNLLLSHLPLKTEAIFADAEHIAIERGSVLYRENSVPSHCIFIESGIASVIATSPDGNKPEAGVIGREGMLPVTAVSADGRMPIEIVMQVRGSGIRIAFSHFRRLFQDDPEFREILLRYANAFFVQCAFTALSNATKRVEERLARWILMCHDRIDGDELELTHEFLSTMLGIRRASVTVALHALEGNRFIRSERGLITIRDRSALEAFAHDAYGRPEQEYERLFGLIRKTA